MYTFEILDTDEITYFIPISEVTYYEIDDEIICALLNYFNPVNEN